MKKPITVYQFQLLLFFICDKETSLDPDNWTVENPFWGHCAAVAMLVQDIFGGELLRASLEGTEFSQMRSHYWNRLPDGTEVDFTRFQFGDRYPANLQPIIRERSYLCHPQTLDRYFTLVSRFKKFVG